MKKKIVKWILIIIGLIGFQTITYFTIGLRQIKNKLLPDYFASLTHHSDSVFVRDFYISNCFVGDQNIYFSHNLHKKPDYIKEKFKVKFVYFDSEDDCNLGDLISKKYNLVYNTWSSRLDWRTLYYFYGVTQTETLLTDKKYYYKREVHYHWILFFWIKTFEWFESSEIKNNN